MEPQVIRQTDVTYYSHFGKFKFIHVSIDTFSRALHASTLMGESANNIQGHWLEAFSHLGRRQQIKTDNGLGIQPDLLNISYKDGEFNTKQVSLIIPQAKQLLNVPIIPLKLSLTNKKGGTRRPLTEI